MDTLNLPIGVTAPRKRGHIDMVPAVRMREEFHFLAQYYAWMARKNVPPSGNNPLTGMPWISWNRTVWRLGRASYLALARECYAIARQFGPTPLP